METKRSTQLDSLHKKYAKLGNNIWSSYKDMKPEQKEVLVKALIDVVVEKMQYAEYTEMCDKMFLEPKQ